MNEPIQYREYIITVKSDFFWYEHVEYTGADDKRCGHSYDLSEAKADIDNMTIEEQEHQISILRKKVEELSHLLELERKFWFLNEQPK